MSRRTNAKPGALAAPGDATTTPSTDPRVAELEALRAQDAETIAKLRADLDDAVAAAVQASDERDAMRAERDNASAGCAALTQRLDEMRADFRRDWDRREQEIETAMRNLPPDHAARAGRLPPEAPVRGKVLRATCLLRAHNRAGDKVTIPAGHPIPDDVDPSTLDRGTTEES